MTPLKKLKTDNLVDCQEQWSLNLGAIPGYPLILSTSTVCAA